MGDRPFGSKFEFCSADSSHPPTCPFCSKKQSFRVCCSYPERFQFSNDQPEDLKFVAAPAVRFAGEQLNCSLKGASAGPGVVAFHDS